MLLLYKLCIVCSGWYLVFVVGFANEFRYLCGVRTKHMYVLYITFDCINHAGIFVISLSLTLDSCRYALALIALPTAEEVIVR